MHEELYIKQAPKIHNVRKSKSNYVYHARICGYYLALELGWHFTACRIKEKQLKPCIFKQVKCRLVANAG